MSGSAACRRRSAASRPGPAARRADPNGCRGIAAASARVAASPGAHPGEAGPCGPLSVNPSPSSGSVGQRNLAGRDCKTPVPRSPLPIAPMQALHSMASRARLRLVCIAIACRDLLRALHASVRTYNRHLFRRNCCPSPSPLLALLFHPGAFSG